jgi:hypothetical protein
MHDTYPDHLILLDLSILISLKKYKLWNISLCSFLHPPVTSSILGPNTYSPQHMFTNTLSQCSLNVNRRTRICMSAFYQIIMTFASREVATDLRLCRSRAHLPVWNTVLHTCLHYLWVLYSQHSPKDMECSWPEISYKWLRGKHFSLLKYEL